MVVRALLLWLSLGWLTEAVVNPGLTYLCDLEPCKCTVGKLACDCSKSPLKEVLLKGELLNIFSISTISVTNCFHLHVASQAVSDLRGLQQISIANVKQLTLEEQAFRWTTQEIHHTGVVINITNTALPDVPSYTFQGSIRDIILSSVNISTVRAFAFSSIDHASRIEFNKVNVKEMETQFFKKFSVDHLLFSNSQFGMIPYKGVLDIEVLEEVRFDKVKFEGLGASAFQIHSPKNVRITQCTIGHVQPYAFDVHSKGDVSIHDNVFLYLEENSFAGFVLEGKYLRDMGREDLIFENNTIQQLEDNALVFNTTGFDPRFDWILINQQCSCVNATKWIEDIVIFSSISQTTGFQSELGKLIFCLNTKPISVGDFQKNSCNETKISAFFKLVAIILGVLVMIVIAVAIYCGIRSRAKRYINVPTSASSLRPAEAYKGHMLVVPEGKTYRETELHVIVEHAEPIINNYVKERPDINN